MKLVYGREAGNDLDLIFDFIAADSVNRANRMVDRVMVTCNALTESPGLGVEGPELSTELAKVRAVHEGVYTIFYTEIERTISILRILHGARDINLELFSSI